jgi:lipoprotein NlpI
VIQLSYERFSLAIDDFNDAIKHDPTIGDAFVNRGAAEIGQRKFAAGRDDIDHGLALGADEPQKAYYNRGLADEYLDDETAAFNDYTKSSQIDPQWIWPKHELARFTVTPK